MCPLCGSVAVQMCLFFWLVPLAGGHLFILRILWVLNFHAFPVKALYLQDICVKQAEGLALFSCGLKAIKPETYTIPPARAPPKTFWSWPLNLPLESWPCSLWGFLGDMLFLCFQMWTDSLRPVLSANQCDWFRDEKIPLEHWGSDLRLLLKLMRNNEDS